MSPDYVLDRMQMYEISPLLDNLYRKNKDNWEQTRLICYLTAQVNSSKKLDPEDILKFSWEDEKEEPKDTTVSSEDRERLRRQAKKYLNTIQDGLSNEAITQ